MRKTRQQKRFLRLLAQRGRLEDKNVERVQQSLFEAKETRRRVEQHRLEALCVNVFFSMRGAR